MESFEMGMISFISVGIMAMVFLLPVLFKEALTPQPGLEPDGVDRFIMSLPGLYKRVRQSPVKIFNHYGVKVYHTWLRWQGYVPIRLSTRVVWQPTHTILTPHQPF